MADEEQEVDVGEVALESSSSLPASHSKTAPPPLPSTSSLPPEIVAASFSAPPPSTPAGSLPPAGSHAPSVAPSMAPSTAPPEPAGRGPAFYGVVLLVLFVVTIGAGALVAMTRKKDAPPAPAATTQAGPKVINMPVVDMADDTDAAAPASSAP